MNKYLAGALLSAVLVTPLFASAQGTGIPGDVDPGGGQTSCVDLRTDLRYRSTDTGTGGSVSLLQDFLQTKRYLSSEPTGYFGLLTQAAVKQFQANSGILNSGYVGPVTRAKIRDVSCGDTSGTAPSISFVGAPTLKITYSSSPRSEVNLVGSATVVVTAGSSDFDASYLSGLIELKNTSTGSRGTSDHSDVTVTPAKTGMTVPAGNSATFTITLTSPAKELFAGVYVLAANSLNLVNQVGSWITISPSSYKNISLGADNVVLNAIGCNSQGHQCTLIGETSPYITSVTNDATPNINVTITGTRFHATSNKVLLDGQSRTYPSFNNGQYINFQMTDFGATKSGSHLLQVISPSGESNKVSFSVSETGTTRPTITVTAPRGGEEVLNLGKNVITTIRWASANIGNLSVNIDLLTPAGYVVRRIAAIVPNSGSYSWLYDSTLASGKYQLLISTNDKGPSAAAKSDIFSVRSSTTGAKTPVITSIQAVKAADPGTIYVGEPAIAAGSLSGVDVITFYSSANPTRAIAQIRFSTMEIDGSQGQFETRVLTAGNYIARVTNTAGTSNDYSIQAIAPTSVPTITPIITSFGVKSLTSSGAAPILWQASAPTDASLEVFCTPGTINFKTDKGNSPTCEKGGVWTWIGQTGDSITVTPSGNTKPVTTTFRLTLLKNGVATTQSQSMPVTFPATVSLPPIDVTPTPEPPKPDFTTWLTALYQTEFGRAPDAAGLSYWNNQLITGAMTQAQVQSTFHNSLEGVRFFVAGLYRKYLLREPDAGGLDYWSNQIYSGAQTREAVESQFRALQGTGAAVINAIPSTSANAPTTSASRYMFTQDLYRGQTGPEVAELQKALGVEVTGNFYDQTREAVMAYQIAHGISPTGYVGAATRSVLNSR